MTVIIGVRFRKSGKVYYFAPDDLPIKKDDHVIVETARGIEYGLVVLGPKEVTEDKVVQPLKSVIRIATPEDDEISKENEMREKHAYKVCLEKISKHGLNMKLIDSEYTFDRNKLLFYFTADGRIDFRELVKDLASVFRTRIELRQIGVRDETKMIGGIAICGRPLCCHSYLSDFAPVSIKMAKEQNLSLNPSKISGVCGRLMCCLKNEEEAYEYLNRILPHIGTKVKTIDGYQGEVQSVSVLKQRVKVLLMHEDDEKEVREYHVSELQFEKKGRSANAPVAVALPDEELDENALRELEELEKEDLEEAAEKTSSSKSRNEYRKKHSNKNYNHNETNHDTSYQNEEEEPKKYRKKYYNNRSQNQNNRNSHYHSNSKNNYRSNKNYNKSYNKSNEHHSQGY
ncbi:MAG TPA: stage 0 sporulation protein [Lachnospiraceae bacterium]|nr:stage 0 sporulation protein [Lachnospiraceae bacterium]